MSASIKRYRMVSPERYSDLIRNYHDQKQPKESLYNESCCDRCRIPESRPSTPVEEPQIGGRPEAYRILEFLPLSYRKNSEIILSYLAQVDDSIFQVMPGTMELIINNSVISGSNLLEILKGFHFNLPTSKKTEGLWTLLYLLAKATPAPVGLFQSPKIRARFEEMKQGKFDHANFIK